MTLLDDSGLALRGVLLKITLSEHAAGDLMQDLFIRLYESKGFAQARDSFAYAWRAAVNLAFDWRRRQKSKGYSLDDATPPIDPNSAAETISVNEDIERVLNAVGRLKEPGRTVIIQRYLEQSSYEQIAHQLGKNPSHIRSLCSKTLQKLRDQLTSTASTAHRGGAS